MRIGIALALLLLLGVLFMWAGNRWFKNLERDIARSFRRDYDELKKRRERVNARAVALGQEPPYKGEHLGLEDYYREIGE